MSDTAPRLALDESRLVSLLRRRGDRLVDAAQTMQSLHRADRRNGVHAGIVTWTAPAAAFACGLAVFSLIAMQLLPRFLLPIQVSLHWFVGG